MDRAEAEELAEELIALSERVMHDATLDDDSRDFLLAQIRRIRLRLEAQWALLEVAGGAG